MSVDNRPLSPHLDIYRWRITMLTSTLHRASGAFLSLGLFFLVIKLAYLAIGGVTGFSVSGLFANLFWMLWTLALYYHLCNGVRHLVWDIGKGFDLKTTAIAGKIVIAGSLALTLLTWLFL